MSRMQTGVLPRTLLAKSHETQSMHVSQAVVDTVALDAAGVYARLKTRPEGLTTAEAAARLAEHGQNVLAKDQRPGFLRLLWHAVLNPLVILLAVLATVSFATGDARAATMMLLMIGLSVGLKLIQEAKANNAAAKLKAMISVKATVLRDGTAAGDRGLAPRARRRRPARRGRHDPGRRARRPGQGPLRDPGLAHRGELPGREVRRGEEGATRRRRSS